MALLAYRRQPDRISTPGGRHSCARRTSPRAQRPRRARATFQAPLRRLPHAARHGGGRQARARPHPSDEPQDAGGGNAAQHDGLSLRLDLEPADGEARRADAEPRSLRRRSSRRSAAICWRRSEEDRARDERRIFTRSRGSPPSPASTSRRSGAPGPASSAGCPRSITRRSASATSSRRSLFLVARRPRGAGHAPAACAGPSRTC